MKTFTYTIQDELGIHARPAGMLVKETGKWGSTITIRLEEKSADAKRIFAIMGLAVKKGHTVTVTVEGPDEDAAAEALETFFRENL